MTDDTEYDIVQQLRDWSHIIEGSSGRGRVIMTSGSLFDEAANEIETLSKELDDLVCAFDDAYAETRRLRAHLDWWQTNAKAIIDELHGGDDGQST